MDAMEYFPDELQENLDLMAEKELRVRVPIEELELLLEDWRKIWRQMISVLV